MLMQRPLVQVPSQLVSKCHDPRIGMDFRETVDLRAISLDAVSSHEPAVETYFMNVQQILASKASLDVETIDASAKVVDAVRVLAAKRIGALIVRDGATIVAGILSERDIVRKLGEAGPACLDMPVSQIMTSEVVTAQPDESAVSVMERMTHGRFRHMPVMRGNELAGVISIGDVVKARISEMELENDAMATMLAG